MVGFGLRWSSLDRVLVGAHQIYFSLELFRSSICWSSPDLVFVGPHQI